MRDFYIVGRLPSCFKLLFFLTLVPVFLAACGDSSHIDVTDKEIVEKPEEINARAEDVIQGTLKDLITSSTGIADSLKIRNTGILQFLYEENSYQPFWSSKGLFSRNGDSLFALITSAYRYGLFPEDYNISKLTSQRNQLIADTSSKDKKLDASLWAYSDMLLTSAFIQVIKDVKVGRLLPDSVVARDTTLTNEFFSSSLKQYKQENNDDFVAQFEPQHSDYQKLKNALRSFLDTATFENYTYVRTMDSTQIPFYLLKRLGEEDSTIIPGSRPDSLRVADAIKRYQKRWHLKEDGKITATLVNRLNDTDKERFIRIAINMDRYKQLQPLPEKYIWVNIPSYYLQLRDSDTVVLKSRVVVGKPLTKTPIITSAISDMVTYPKWTIPESIIKKEILPGLKKDTGYTIRRGYTLVDTGGNEINPYMVDWSKYKNSIPYKVVQGSGDDNALGILKFNFPNKYSVYLHDTNQRYLFSNSSRALSHGCVRVQAWEALAKYILRNDSTYATNAIPVDSMMSWLATKQKRYIPVRKPIPVFIRYFTCSVNDDKLAFYEDIYGEDRKIREKIFSNK
ncbi:MAG: murein L,D-transpeptidase [Flavisolibacter sp.]